MNLKQLSVLVPFGLFMYSDLLKITKNLTLAKKYKESYDFEAEREQIRQAEQYWASSLVSKTNTKINITGIKNVPDGPVLFVSNHQSYCDIVLFFAAINRQIGFVAKEEASKIPVFGKLILATRSVFIKRNDPRQGLKAIDRASQYIKEGFTIAIFPEGTRSKGRGTLAFKKGALKPAFNTEVPIVPITISGSYKLWEEKGHPEYGVSVDFYIHPPIQTKGTSRAEQNAIAAMVENTIKGKLKELSDY